MPFVEITVVSGREPEAIRNLMREVHGAVTSSLGVPDQSVRVAVREIPKEHWSAANVTYAEKEAAQAASEVTS